MAQITSTEQWVDWITLQMMSEDDRKKEEARRAAL